MNPLVQHALVGTAKQSTGGAFDHPAVAIVAQRNELSAERRLLLLAGAAALHDRAGYVPARAPQLPEPAPTERRPVCSPQTAAIVVDLLDRAINDQSLLVEALDLIQAAEQVLPATLLAKALRVSSRREVRTAMRGVLGERGRWLAGFNDEWRWARHYVDDSQNIERLPHDAETIWQEGELAARAALLTLARRCDAEKSRTWLSAVWNVEKAEARAKLLEAFAAALTSDDLPLLEQALKDRGAAVRKLAAEALATLDDSPLAARMRERARGMVAYTPTAKPTGLMAKFKGLAGKSPATGQLEISIPVELPADWAEDSIEAKPPKGIGERAFWLRQVIAHVSPRHWQATTGLTPADFIIAVSATDHAEAFVGGLASAALAFRSNDWLAAIWDYGVAQSTDKRQSQHNWGPLLQRLLAAMQPSDAEIRLANSLLAPADSREWELAQAIESLPRPWSESFGQSYLQWCWDASHRNSSSFRDCWNSLKLASVALPERCFAAALSTPPELLPDNSNRSILDQIEKFQETIRLRQRMRAVLYA